jgi:prephenate dehydrogenase
MNRSSRDTVAVPATLLGRSIGVVGLGQIGGSLVQRLSRYRPSIAVHGFDLRADLARLARRYCHWCIRLDDLVGSSDIVILAVPVPGIVRLLPKVARAAAKRTSGRRLLVCDVGTAKEQVVEEAASFSASFDFVGLHPLAGGERNGWDQADPRLFDRRTVVFCPTGRKADRVARDLIGLLGGLPRPMSPKLHDELCAEGIGLPHLLAFAAAALTARHGVDQPLRGGSWASLTRVAASDAKMVAGFLHANAANERRVLRRFRARLAELERLLARPTSRALERRLRAWQTQLTGR